MLENVDSHNQVEPKNEVLKLYEEQCFVDLGIINR